ncbi:MAG TPA: hypothetical protein VJY54_14590 [Lachnospiraceae bacterium]|nr:hypothetical protein [Lachnospiraceae bacterium]
MTYGLIMRDSVCVYEEDDNVHIYGKNDLADKIVHLLDADAEELHSKSDYIKDNATLIMKNAELCCFNIWGARFHERYIHTNMVQYKQDGQVRTIMGKIMFSTDGGQITELLAVTSESFTT